MSYKCSTGEIAETYQEYLQTRHWKAFRRKVIGRKGRKKCTNCRSKKHIHVHHMTYENVGFEKLDDVTILCSVCHKLHHDLLNKGLKSDVCT